MQSKINPTEIVYAELALGPITVQENKPQHERTEYAEIIYKKQPIENQMDTKDVQPAAPK